MLLVDVVTVGELTVDDLGRRVAIESDALGTRYGVIAAVDAHPFLYEQTTIRFIGPALPLIVRNDVRVSLL